MAGAYQATFKRIEVKYLLSDAQYRALRERLEKEDIAEEDAYGRTNIRNIYFDTPDDALIRRSLEKPSYKEKLRLRTYGAPSGDSRAFIEIKKKADGVVYKRRVGMSYNRALSYMRGTLEADKCLDALDGSAQILKEIDYFRHFYKGLRPKMVITYDRIAMAGTADPELRLTFDENIRYRTSGMDLKTGGGRALLEPGQHLMEVKVAGALPLKLARIFSELLIVPCSYSKYGTAYTDLRQRRQQVRESGKIVEFRLAS